MMANEEKKPTPPPTPFNEANAPEPVKETQDKTIRELRDVPVEAVPDAALAAEDEAVKHAETPEARETRRAAEGALNKPIEGIEDAVNAMDKEDQALAEHALPHRVSNQTVLMGYTIPLPIYTVVYVTLAIFTAIEVGISTLPHGWLGTAALVGLSGAKAVLVVLFYMHLKEDSRLFAFALILPLFIAIVASLFLLTVPTHGY
jgi:cytochrome c oxidase subunit 4